MLSNFMGGGLNAVAMDKFPQLIDNPAYQGIMSMAPENVGESLMNLPAGKAGGFLIGTVFKKMDDLYDARRTYKKAEGGSKGLFKNEIDKIDEEIERLTARSEPIMNAYIKSRANQPPKFDPVFALSRLKQGKANLKTQLEYAKKDPRPSQKNRVDLLKNQIKMTETQLDKSEKME